MRKQNTLKANCEFTGIGLHSGNKCLINVKPAPEDTGIVFVNKSGQTNQFIPYNTENVTDTVNNITVSNGKSLVKTVEHLTAALYALQIDNCLIETSSNEIPIMDGSSKDFVAEFSRIGTVQQEKNREEFRVINPIWVTSGDKYMVALPYNGLKLSYTINFPNSPIGVQTYQTEINTDIFNHNLANARTFGFIEDLDYYQKNGLVLGVSYDNVHAFSKKENKCLNNSRYDDEPVRHKVLDLVGGLALLNFDLKAFVISYKSGHSLDVQFSRKIISILSGRNQLQTDYHQKIDSNYYYNVADLLELSKNPS
jgi:UDP-3-O-acyl N-acetylglucosamine deacetylase